MMGARRKFGRCRLPSDRLGTQPQFQLRLSTPRSGQGGGENGSFFFSPPFRLVGSLPAAKISSTAAGSLQRSSGGRSNSTPTKPSAPCRRDDGEPWPSRLPQHDTPGRVSDGTGKTFETHDSIPSCHFIFVLFFSHLNEREYLSRMREQRHGQKLFSRRAPTLTSSMGTLYMLSGAGTGPKSDHRRQQSQS